MNLSLDLLFLNAIPTFFQMQFLLFFKGNSYFYENVYIILTSKKSATSNSANQAFLGFIESQRKKYFAIPLRAF